MKYSLNRGTYNKSKAEGSSGSGATIRKNYSIKLCPHGSTGKLKLHTDGNLHRLYAWKQTRIYSCGPAALMTALAEYGKAELSEKSEIAIWKKVRNMLFMGSTPAYLARFAKSRGVSARLWIRSGNGPEKRYGKTLFHRLLHSHLLRVYRKTAVAYRKQGNEVSDYREESEITGVLRSSPEAKAIYLIADDDEIFHFILARQQGGRLVVMDPANGANTHFTEAGFLARYEPKMLGYCVLLGKVQPVQ
ncbi:MAG: peptidase C39 family protein [Deltaproteobacteria bacterium]|nr:peptidase C39 family protein [Deltaproteobacteria bacterium]